MRFLSRTSLPFVIALWGNGALAADAPHPLCERPGPNVSAATSLQARLPADALQAFRDANDAMAAQKWSVAAREFQRAYDLSRVGEIQWNIASAEEREGNLLGAWQAMGRYLDSGEGYDLGEACQFMASVRARLGEVIVRVSEPGAAFLLDGVQASDSGTVMTLLANPGKHTVRVEKPGFVSAQIETEFEPGKRREVDVQLVPIAPRLSPEPPPPDEPAPSFPVVPPPIVDAEEESLPWGWIGLGAALLAGGIAGTYFLVRPDDEHAAPLVHGSIETIQLPLVW